MKPEYRYAFHWQEGDVLMWEESARSNNAVADYGPGEHRLVKRCQVMATMFYPRNGGGTMKKHSRRSPLQRRARSRAAAAQGYPRSGEVLVGFAAGGPTDVIARIVAQDMTSRSASLRRREPARRNAIIATEAVARSVPDRTTRCSSRRSRSW